MNIVDKQTGSDESKPNFGLIFGTLAGVFVVIVTVCVVLDCHCKEKAFTMTSVSQLKDPQHKWGLFFCNELITFGKIGKSLEKKLPLAHRTISFPLGVPSTDSQPRTHLVLLLIKLSCTGNARYCSLAFIWMVTKFLWVFTQGLKKALTQKGTAH